MILFATQVAVVGTMLAVAAVNAGAFKRLICGRPGCDDLYRLPIFFIALDIAYNVGLFAFAFERPPMLAGSFYAALAGQIAHILIGFMFLVAAFIGRRRK